MVTLYGRQTSSNVQAVMWLVNEIGLDCDRLDVGGAFGGNNTSEFLAMNPMGRVPVLRDGELTMFESQSILRYLARRYDPSGLWPSDLFLRAKADQWMEWAKTSVVPVLTYKVFWQMVRVTPDQCDTELLKIGIAEIAHLMAMAEERLQNDTWLAGDRMSLADISFGTQLFRYFTLDIDRPNLPALRSYYDRLCTRPAYAGHVMISYESLRPVI